MSRNSSQDPNYEGPIGKEKRVHKNMFLVSKPWRGTGENWVKIRTGRYKLIRNEKASVMSRVAEEQ